MEIGPIRDDTPAVERPVVSKETPKEPPKSEAKTDSLDLSEESTQRLEAASGEAVDLAKVQDRIQSGYYDSPQVREKVIERLTDELLENIRRFYK